ncbi:MAG: hypothetical protein M5U26_06115 [Planctomycetota bacterium]|nr:hypothetical protein [Planctomycetota bacterium]
MRRAPIFVLPSLVLSLCAAFAEDAAPLATLMVGLRSEEFEARVAAEAGLRKAVLEGREDAVKEALEAARKAHPDDDELKHRGARLLNACEGGPIVHGLRLRLLAEPQAGQTELGMRAPFNERPRLVLRLTNLNAHAVQVPRSSYPCFYHFKLDVVRLDGAERVPLKVMWDLYPTKDMEMPHQDFVTLEPGGWIEQNLELLLREGYLMMTYARGFTGFQKQVENGFAALRKPGRYELTGRYRREGHDGDGPARYEGNVGRKPEIALWAGEMVRTKPAILNVAEP